MSWPAGTIVVCIDDAPHPRIPLLFSRGKLVKGDLYTVRKSRPGNFLFGSQSVAVWVNEVTRVVPTEYIGTANHPFDHPFPSDRFRRLESSHSEAGSVRREEPVSV